MTRVDDSLLKKAVRTAERADFFAKKCKERLKELEELNVKSPDVDTTDEINLLLSILSLSRATKAEYEKCKQLYEQAKKAANGDLEEEDDKFAAQVAIAETANAAAVGPKEKAEALLDSGPIIRSVTCQIDDFLNTANNKKRIYERLEDCDESAHRASQAQRKSKDRNGVKTSSDMIFIAESLPIIHGIIHVSTSRETLSQAIKWIREYWGETANSLVVLSALVFTYVAEKGVNDPDNSTKTKAERWESIKRRIEKFAGS